MKASSIEIELAMFLESENINGYETEYRFLEKRRYRFDFAWPDLKLAVECEGGIWNGGRHTRGAGFQNDCEKYNEAALLGWTVLRVTADQVRNGKALNWIQRFLVNCEMY